MFNESQLPTDLGERRKGKSRNSPQAFDFSDVAQSESPFLVDKSSAIIAERAGDFLTTDPKNTKRLEIAIVETLKKQLLESGAGIREGRITYPDGTEVQDIELKAMAAKYIDNEMPLALVIGKGKDAKLEIVPLNHEKRGSLLSGISLPRVTSLLVVNKLLPEFRYFNDEPTNDRQNFRTVGPTDFPVSANVAEAKEAFKQLRQYLHLNVPDQLQALKMLLKHFLFAKKDKTLPLYCIVLFGPNAGGKGSMLRILEAIPWCRPPNQFSFAHASAEYTTGNFISQQNTLSVCTEIGLDVQPKIFPQMMKSATRRESLTVRVTGAKAQTLRPSHSFVLMANTSQQGQKEAAFDEVSRFLAVWDAFDRFHLGFIDWRTSGDGSRIGDTLDRMLTDPVGRLALAHEVFAYGLTLERENIPACLIDERYKELRQEAAAPALTVFLEQLCFALLNAYERLTEQPTCDNQGETARVLGSGQQFAIIADCLRPVCKEFADSLEVVGTAPSDPFVGYLIPSAAFAPMIKKLVNAGQKWQVPVQLKGLVDRTAVRRPDRRFVAFNIDKIRVYHDQHCGDDAVTKSETGPPGLII